MRVNMNKTKVMISGEWQKAVRWPCGVSDDHDRCKWMNVSFGTGSPGLSRTKSREP